MIRSISFGLIVSAVLAAQPLTRRNVEAPFCYVPGSARSWPVLAESPADMNVSLSAVRGGAVITQSRGRVLTFGGLRVEFDARNKLRVTSTNKAEAAAFDLRIDLSSGGRAIQSQTVQVRAASPKRPIAYYADFADDLLNIYGLGFSASPPSLLHQLREGGAPAGPPSIRTADALPVIDRQGLDQYFRRLQCQGIEREILWLSPFSLVTDAGAYDPADWKDLTERANAIARSKDMAAIQRNAPGFSSWGLLRDQMVFRLDPKLHQALSDSAIEHGISLALSYRPLEQGVSKYYDMAVFDSEGRYLGQYLPLASPTVNAHPDRVGFAHYREVLRQAGRGDEAEPVEIELRVVGDAPKTTNLRLLASGFAPIQSDSFVLVRHPGGSYELMRWREVQPKAEARLQPVTGFQVETGPGMVRLKDVKIPEDASYLLIDDRGGEAPLTLDSRRPAILRNRKGEELGRNVTWFSYDGTSGDLKKTRLGGITADGEYNPVFFAAEAGVAHAYKLRDGQPLRNAVLVIHRGDRFSSEMVDFTLPAAREAAIREIRAVMKYPAFRSIYLNTRTHTQLVADTRDGVDGLQPYPYYEAPRKGIHIGIDLAYAPRLAGRDPKLAKAPLTEFANFSPGEFAAQCQTADCTHPWRLVRNREVARGIRDLILDLKRAFPHVPIEVVVPESEAVSRQMAQFQTPDAVPHTAGRYNYIQSMSEGMAMLDLTGTGARPVLLGTGAFVSPAVLERFLDAALKDRPGARAIMYEGQYALSDAKGKAAREGSICRMLARPEISEVVLYEAADWAYRLPRNGFDFLENCSKGTRVIP